MARRGDAALGHLSERAALRTLLLWLHGRRIADHVMDERQRAILDKMARHGFEPIAERALEAALAVDGKIDLKGTGKVLLLGPIPKQPLRMAVLSLLHDESKADPEMRVRVAIFYVDSRESDKLRAIGFRYETPEGIGGRHHFYHAQPITKLNGSPLPCDQMLLEDMPSIGLDADGAVSLLVCALVSIYGQPFLEWLPQETHVWAQLKGFVGGVYAFRKPYLVSYWEVHTAHETLFYTTRMLEPDFRQYVNALHSTRRKGTTRPPDIRPSTYEAFHAAAEAAQHQC